MGIICTKHDKEMTIVKTDRLAKNWTAIYRCPEGHNVTLKESDWSNTIPFIKQKCPYCNEERKFKLFYDKEYKSYQCNNCSHILTTKTSKLSIYETKIIMLECHRCKTLVLRDYLMLLGCQWCGGSNGSKHYGLLEAKYGKKEKRHYGGFIY